VIGSVETVGGISVEQMRSYHTARYAPDNMVFCVAGAFDWDAVIGELTKWCNGWTRGNASRDTPPHQGTSTIRELRKKDLNRAHVAVVMPGPSVQEDDRFAAELLMAVLGDVSGSKLYWELVDTGICDAAYLDSEPMDGTGFMMSYASTLPDRVPQVLSVINRILDKPLDFGEVDLSRAKTKALTRLALQAESSSRRMFSVGLSWLNSKKYLSPQAEEDIVRGITFDKIRELVLKYPLDKRTIVTLLPE
jgi:predicted Zn-dependent peptidase